MEDIKLTGASFDSVTPDGCISAYIETENGPHREALAPGQFDRAREILSAEEYDRLTDEVWTADVLAAWAEKQATVQAELERQEEALRPLREQAAAEAQATQLFNRLVLEMLAPTLKDAETILQLKPVLPVWEPGRHYPHKALLVWEDVVYQVADENGVDALAHYPPGGTGVYAYKPVNMTSAGTEADPIPAMAGMACTKGLFYIEDGALYKCTRDYDGSTGHLPSQLVGHYFEEV